MATFAVSDSSDAAKCGLAFLQCACRGVEGSTATARRERDCAVCLADSFALLWEAMVLTRSLRAKWSSTGSGAQGLTLVMSRSRGCGLQGGRLRGAPLEKRGLSVESRVILVTALPPSSWVVMAWLLAACVTLASCASDVATTRRGC